eukprot:s4996_g2.t1
MTALGATEEKSVGQLDAQQLLRAIGQGVGGKEPCRRLTASASLLQAVRLLVSRPEALDRLRASDGFRLAVEAWKQGTHIPEVAQERLVCMLCSVMIELMIPKIVVQPYWIAIAMLYTVWTKTLCCALMLQLASQHARAAAAAGAAECALSSWQRCGTATDLSLRAALVHGFAEVSCLCLPFFPEKPQVLCRLACEPRHYQGDLGLRCRGVRCCLKPPLRSLIDSLPTPLAFQLSHPSGQLGLAGGRGNVAAAEALRRQLATSLKMCASLHLAIESGKGFAALSRACGRTAAPQRCPCGN